MWLRWNAAALYHSVGSECNTQAALPYIETHTLTQIAKIYIIMHTHRLVNLLVLHQCLQ